MDGSQLPQRLQNKQTDPFDAGQLVGMLVMLKFIECNNGIEEDTLERLMITTADALQGYFERPSEDIHLIIDNLVKEIK